MGTALVVIGILFLLGGLAISIYEAFDIGDRFQERRDNLEAAGEGQQLEITKELIEALKDLLDVFARLTVGVQISLIGLVLVYWGLRL